PEKVQKLVAPERQVAQEVGEVALGAQIDLLDVVDQDILLDVAHQQLRVVIDDAYICQDQKVVGPVQQSVDTEAQRKQAAQKQHAGDDIAAAGLGWIDREYATALVAEVDHKAQNKHAKDDQRIDEEIGAGFFLPVSADPPE